jgi:hydrogenase nickel incorporation protein HypB
VTAVPRIVEVRQKVLKQNDVIARQLRQRFQDAGVFVVSLASSPGSEKAAFLEKTLTVLRADYRVAALVGDLETDNDAVRLARANVPVKQITTGTVPSGSGNDSALPRGVAAGSVGLPVYRERGKSGLSFLL